MVADMLLALGSFVLAMGIFAAFVGGIGYWILGPMHRATRKSELPTQFFVSDFIWLVAQLQIALAAVVAMPFRIGSFGSGFLLIVSVVTIAAMWWASVTALSRAGVRSPLRRAAFILLVVPVGSVGGIVTFFCIFVGIMSLMQRITMGYEDTYLSWLLLLTIPTAALFYAIRRLDLWVLAGGEREEEMQP